MSWTRVWIHLVFSTKDRQAYLHQSIRRLVFEHIKQNAESKGIRLDCVNGFSDHAHCLISLGKDQTISQAAQLIKGESSYWINKNRLTAARFSWQDDYWAVSVSEGHLQAVRNYIFNQEAHHKKKSFQEEIEKLID
jgi:REP element-mobilizing transposase RayT